MNIKLVKHFVANITDIYDDDAIATFLNDGKLNIDNILNHHLTKLSVLYQVIFNHLYGTWATKKEFMLFCTNILNIKKNYNNFHVAIDVNLVNAILSHYPFFIARIGAVHKLNSIHDIATTAIQRLNETSCATYICDVIQQKWKYRYGAMDIEKMSASNILKTFVKYQLNNNVSLPEHSQVWKSTTGFLTEHNELNIEDYDYMNKYEVIQYHLHCDNRFLLQLATYAVILRDNDDYSDDHTLNLIKSIHQHSKKHAIVLSVGVDKFNHTRFSYKIESDLYAILPRISTKLYLFSSDKVLISRSLCTVPNECMLITKNPSILTPQQLSPFAITLTPSISEVAPHQSIYHLPCTNSWKLIDVVKDVHLSLWKEYNNLKCPSKLQNSRHCGVLFANFISLYLHKNSVHIHDILHEYNDVVDKYDTNVPIVAVDNRFNILTLLSVIISLYNVVKHKQNNGFYGVIYTSKQSIDKYKDIICKIGLSNLIQLRVHHTFDDIELFHMEVYNQVLKSEHFWKSLECNKCIIVQDDGFLMNGKFINHFLKYDYVGAPWADAKDNEYIKKNINHELVGNGGFSIRDVGKMIQICQTHITDKNSLFYHNLNEIPEDVYFVKYLVSMGANIAPFDVARKFAIEQVLSVNPVGFHKFWLYNIPSETVKVFDSFLD